MQQRSKRGDETYAEISFPAGLNVPRRLRGFCPGVRRLGTVFTSRVLEGRRYFGGPVESDREVCLRGGQQETGQRTLGHGLEAVAPLRLAPVIPTSGGVISCHTGPVGANSLSSARGWLRESGRQPMFDEYLSKAREQLLDVAVILLSRARITINGVNKTSDVISRKLSLASRLLGLSRARRGGV
jgi:hypothetical protein